MCGSDGSDPDSMLTLYRTAPHRTPTPPHTARPAWRRLAWQPSPTDALAFDGGQSFRCVVNLSRQPIAIAPDATVLLASTDLTDTRSLPPDTTLWLRTNK
ncbi:alpha-glucosidase [Rhodococcus wratislaviensis IFP 2016]|uniref:DUF3459 domain-containing protein n=2 Tax=Rhodococcus opacus TaxID=37919 RepID=UPI0002A3A67B|nr:alpha-glucosidase [Rhodococcus wratislaviensis IFP 2016]